MLAPVIVLGSAAGLMLNALGHNAPASADVAGGPASVLDEAVASPPASAAPASSVGVECSLEAPFTTSCSSTNPKLAIYQWNADDTSTCTFAYHLDWGDGSSSTVDVSGASSSSLYIAEHTYRTPGSYSPTLTARTVTGNCAAADFAYSYTYQ